MQEPTAASPFWAVTRSSGAIPIPTVILRRRSGVERHVAGSVILVVWAAGCVNPVVRVSGKTEVFSRAGARRWGLEQCFGDQIAPRGVGAPKDAIQTSLNIEVTSDAKVGLDPGGMRTAYPSIEIYAYGADGSMRTIYQRTESGNVDDLKRKDQPVPAVAPR